MSDNIAVKVDHVSKNFKLPHERVDSVKSLFVNPFRRREGRGVEVQHALRNIDFEINKGEFFGIVGRNGSGKSTLLKIIAGIYQPTKGRVSVNGRLVPFIELGVGFNPELTGRENVYLNGALMGFNDREIDAKYNEIVEFAELDRFMDQKLKNYSSGMQVRLAFSVATILADSEILLIDEVLAVGDADFQRKCFNYFKQLKKRKKTVVFVSHDMSAVREYCDRVALIENSRLVEVGSADRIAGLYDKLFLKVDGSSSSDQRPDERWGEGQLLTDSVEVNVAEDEIIITQGVVAKMQQVNPIIGFRIRDAAGKEVMGTNTKIEKTPVGSIGIDQRVSVVWSIPNILADGVYYVDAAILLADNHTTADWWDESAEVHVRKPRRLPYAIDPNTRVTVER